MGNCQAIDTAALVIQHPSGRVERLYWPVTASEVMRTNPGHYVALVITLCLPTEKKHEHHGAGVRVTRVKLLKPTDTLVVGQAYRLITSQDVMKGLWAKKYAKLKKKEAEATEVTSVTEMKESACQLQAPNQGLEVNQVKRHGQRTVPSASSRSRQWRPSLQSISEADLHGNHNKQQGSMHEKQQEHSYRKRVFVARKDKPMELSVYSEDER